MVRFFAERARPTRNAMTAALLLAGAHTSELGHITVRDVDVAGRRVWAHGATKYTPRWLTLDNFGFNAVTDLAEYLHDPAAVLCAGAEGAVTDAHKQAGSVRLFVKSSPAQGYPTSLA